MRNSTIFERIESEVRVYCRSFPGVLVRATNHEVWDETGQRFIDFLMGAGSLNYGHNNPLLKSAVIEYLKDDGILHSLDLHTAAKRTFLEKFERRLLQPRFLDYRVQFTGPTGTNTIEAALKLARKATGRHTIVAFTNGFHGVSLGALAATANGSKRAGAGIPLAGVVRMPYDGYFGKDIDTIALMERMLADPSGGIDAPAAFLVETVQGEGGVNVASEEWLRRLADLARRHGALLIVDDIQSGCGRVGTFFSFEGMEFTPDLVCLSKSIGGLGLPMSLLLIAPQWDLWQPGEHNGTFRGNNLAFVAAAGALDLWGQKTFLEGLQQRCLLLGELVAATAARFSRAGVSARGRGMMRGLFFEHLGAAERVSEEAYRRGLICETCGPRDQTLKLLPSLTIPVEALQEGLAIIEAAMNAVFAEIHRAA